MPIFIADDDPAVLSSLQFLLESEGYAVAAFGSGAALLSAFPGPAPGCVILDVMMPGLSGLDVLRRLRELDVHAPILLTTGHPDPSIRERAREAGVPLLEKGLSSEALLAVLARTREVGSA
ncbi:response regulator receiver protein [Methylobacterium sp. 4-46]|uniref:response regulator transcription factor n=1 Tax=unclassified Methylobacterium TaxID=2615210 RepID=UPI000152D299|nr:MULTISPECIES: response regulator [Methylobacterium]ACA17254.1 response regulator receiver protein [Methylobacterium sp. 4-46]ACA17289.1 response regulator receiver protein [Methylobacterium sp. 4-46]WFT82940.1 response regulator [Methylobacterium nodulans]WFT82975.1 response regulator [Methylobacterium nodulans]